MTTEDHTSNESYEEYKYGAVAPALEMGTDWYVNQHDVPLFRKWIQNAVTDARVQYCCYAIKNCKTYCGDTLRSDHAVCYVQYKKPVSKTVVRRLTGFNLSNPVVCYDVPGAIKYIQSTNDEVEAAVETGRFVETMDLSSVEPFDAATMGLPTPPVEKMTRNYRKYKKYNYKDTALAKKQFYRSYNTRGKSVDTPELKYEKNLKLKFIQYDPHAKDMYTPKVKRKTI